MPAPVRGMRSQAGPVGGPSRAAAAAVPAAAAAPPGHARPPARDSLAACHPAPTCSVPHWYSVRATCSWLPPAAMCRRASWGGRTHRAGRAVKVSGGQWSTAGMQSKETHSAALQAFLQAQRLRRLLLVWSPSLPTPTAA